MGDSKRWIRSLSLQLIDGYGARSEVLSLDYASLHVIATFLSLVATVLLTFVFLPAGFELQSSRSALIVGYVILGGLTLLYRRFAHERITDYRRGQSILFMGAKEDFDFFKQECVRMEMDRPLVHIDPSLGMEALEPVLASIHNQTLAAEAIVIRESGGDIPSELPLRLVQLYFDGVPTFTLEIFHQAYWRKIPLYRINPIWLLQEGFAVAREPVFERIKRASDIVLSLLGLVAFSPLIVLAAVLIATQADGPVLFFQTRVGRNRVPFRLVKFRTMRTVPEGDPYTRPGDARVTPIGRILRASRLDELPQLWNVLKGEMSLIGPRAEWDRLVADYERQISYYHFRHLVKPGITGWAQINYRYGSSLDDTIRKLEYDLYYIRNYSFLLDASIVLKTLHVMLFRRGR
jgi:lipopolysaccharide/colanic/teichoic acid biosynthesis glycosyltransferase